jgi:hypothetical protein
MILSNKISVPRTVSVASVTSAGTLITAPSAGKNVVLVDLINADGSNIATLKDKHGSAAADTLALVPVSTAVSLNAPILVKTKKVVTGTAHAVANGITVTVEKLATALASGDVITFAGGGVLTLTSGASAAATSLAGNLTVAALTVGETGYTTVKVDVVTSTKFTATYMVED